MLLLTLDELNEEGAKKLFIEGRLCVPSTPADILRNNLISYLKVQRWSIPYNRDIGTSMTLLNSMKLRPDVYSNKELFLFFQRVLSELSIDYELVDASYVMGTDVSMEDTTISLVVKYKLSNVIVEV